MPKAKENWPGPPGPLQKANENMKDAPLVRVRNGAGGQANHVRDFGAEGPDLLPTSCGRPRDAVGHIATKVAFPFKHGRWLASAPRPCVWINPITLQQQPRKCTDARPESSAIDAPPNYADYQADRLGVGTGGGNSDPNRPQADAAEDEPDIHRIMPPATQSIGTGLSSADADSPFAFLSSLNHLRQRWVRSVHKGLLGD
jgi:hypothetical protein